MSSLGCRIVLVCGTVVQSVIIKEQILTVFLTVGSLPYNPNGLEATVVVNKTELNWIIGSQGCNVTAAKESLCSYKNTSGRLICTWTHNFWNRTCPLGRQDQIGQIWSYGAWCCMFGQHQAPYQHKLLKHKQHSGGGVRIWLVLQPQDVMTLQWSIRPTGQWSKIQQLIKVLQWSSQNPYHNLIEILSINEYPQSSSTVLRLERQIKSDRKHWFQIIGAKDGPTNDWLMWCN